MLQEFRVDNFKSLINVVFKPQETNLLIGRNNSGKTNLCQALKFISYSSRHTLDECADAVAHGRFHVTNLALEKSTVDFHVRALFPYQEEDLTFEYDLTISPPRNSVSETSVRLDREVLSVAGAAFDKVVLMENVAGRVRLLDEKTFMCGKRSYLETTAPVDATMLHRIFDSEANPRASLFKENLSAFFYYDLSPDAMRGSARKPREELMAPNGSNLASVLYWLKTGNERKYRDLLAAVQKIEPKLDIINFLPGSEENVFMFFEDRSGHSLSAANASNGTLRFLALSYVLLIQPEVIRSMANLSSPLCIIEEPENGVHVGFLKTLFEMADKPPGGHQLILTSHSPYFIDLFDEHLDGVFVIDRQNGRTSITQPDAAGVKNRLERFPLGEQHFREMLG